MSLPSRIFTPEPTNSNSFEWRIPLSELSYTDEEIERATGVLRSGWWTCGPETHEFELEAARYLGVRHAIAVANGTAALHLAHLSLGTPHGAEVITPSLNFVAAANTILHAGGAPRFADVSSLDSPLVSLKTIERALTSKTVGICLMHYAGYPCAMDEIGDFARSRGLWVIEDAAHSFGGAWRGRACGSWGDAGCFSFFGNKNLTCGEGGLVVTQRDDLAEKLRALRSHGMNSFTWDRYKGHSFSYDVTTAGFNYRIDDLRSALLRVQLRSLDRVNCLRGERAAWYRRLLKDDRRWSIPFSGEREGTSAFHLFPIVLAHDTCRSRVMSFMRDRGIQTSIHYPPIHELTFYRNLQYCHTDLHVTEQLGQRLLTLPLFPDMTRQQVETVCTCLRDALEQCELRT